MKKLVILCIVLLAIAALSACTRQAPPTTNPPPGQSQNSVTISNFAFTPSELKVKVGDTVTWTNKDSAPHTVTSDSGSELASQSLSKGQTYSHTFSQAGTYSYHCSIHTGMKAKVIVE